MKKGKIIAMIFSGILLLAVLGNFLIPWLFSQQYNSNGISHFIVITIDRQQPMTYIGTLDDHSVFAENLDLRNTVVRSVHAENIPMEKAIEEHLVSIDEWKTFARSTRTEGDAEVLQFENYEIVLTEDTCLFKPIAG